MSSHDPKQVLSQGICRQHVRYTSCLGPLLALVRDGDVACLYDALHGVDFPPPSWLPLGDLGVLRVLSILSLTLAHISKYRLSEPAVSENKHKSSQCLQRNIVKARQIAHNVPFGLQSGYTLKRSRIAQILGPNVRQVIIAIDLDDYCTNHNHNYLPVRLPSSRSRSRSTTVATPCPPRLL